MLKSIKPFHPKRHEGAANSFHLYQMLAMALSHAPAATHNEEPINLIIQPDRSDQLWVPPRATRADRRPALRGTASFRGFLLNAVTGRESSFESTIERDLADLCAADRNVVDMEEQPPELTFMDGGVVRHHTFDLRVTRKDRIRIAYACKAEARRVSSDIDRHVELIRQQHPDFADVFEVRTRASVSRLDAWNARMILQARRLRDEVQVAHIASLLEQIHGWIAFETLAALHGQRDLALIATINMIDEGHLVWGGNDRIGPDMSVCVRHN